MVDSWCFRGNPYALGIPHLGWHLPDVERHELYVGSPFIVLIAVERFTMALADPQTLTVNTVAKTLNRIKSDGYSAEYATDDEAFKMKISHQDSKNRTRRMVRIDQRVVAADPLTSINEYKTLGVYLVIDEPEYGFSDTEIDYVVQAFKTWLSSATVLKVCGSQS